MELTQSEIELIERRRAGLGKLAKLQSEGEVDINSIRPDSSPEEKAAYRAAVARALAESGY